MSSKRHRGRGFRITLHKGPNYHCSFRHGVDQLWFPNQARARPSSAVSRRLGGARGSASRLTTYISEAPYANTNTALPYYICGMLGFLWMKYSTRFMRDAVRCTVRSFIALKPLPVTRAGTTCIRHTNFMCEI